MFRRKGKKHRKDKRATAEGDGDGDSAAPQQQQQQQRDRDASDDNEAMLASLVTPPLTPRELEEEAMVAALVNPPHTPRELESEAITAALFVPPKTRAELECEALEAALMCPPPVGNEEGTKLVSFTPPSGGTPSPRKKPSLALSPRASFRRRSQAAATNAAQLEEWMEDANHVANVRSMLSLLTQPDAFEAHLREFAPAHVPCFRLWLRCRDLCISIASHCGTLLPAEIEGLKSAHRRFLGGTRGEVSLRRSTAQAWAKLVSKLSGGRRRSLVISPRTVCDVGGDGSTSARRRSNSGSSWGGKGGKAVMSADVAPLLATTQLEAACLFLPSLRQWDTARQAYNTHLYDLQQRERLVLLSWVCEDETAQQVVQVPETLEQLLSVCTDLVGTRVTKLGLKGHAEVTCIDDVRPGDTLYVKAAESRDGLLVSGSRRASFTTSGSQGALSDASQSPRRRDSGTGLFSSAGSEHTNEEDDSWECDEDAPEGDSDSWSGLAFAGEYHLSQCELYVLGKFYTTFDPGAMAQLLARVESVPKMTPELREELARDLIGDNQLRKCKPILGDGYYAMLDHARLTKIHSVGSVTYLSCGENNIAVVTKQGVVHTAGPRDMEPRVLGRCPGASRHSSAIELPKEGSRWKFRCVAAGVQHMVALPQRKHIVTWGLNTSSSFDGELINAPLHHQLGRNALRDTARAIPGSFPDALAVACGSDHSVVLCADGVYAFGNNDRGQCGADPQAEPSVACPLNVGGALKGLEVVSIACGSKHTLACTAKGTVYAWGCNEWGQLGVEIAASGKDRTVSRPIAVFGLLDQRVVQVAAGNTFSVGLTDDGVPWSWGRASYGCLGRSVPGGESTIVSDTVALPGPVTSLPTITQVAACCDRAAALSQEGLVYIWGFLCDVAMVSHCLQPRLVPSLIGDHLFVRQIAAGKSHFAFLTDQSISDLLHVLAEYVTPESPAGISESLDANKLSTVISHSAFPKSKLHVIQNRLHMHSIPVDHPRLRLDTANVALHCSLVDVSEPEKWVTVTNVGTTTAKISVSIPELELPASTSIHVTPSKATLSPGSSVKLSFRARSVTVLLRPSNVLLTIVAQSTKKSMQSVYVVACVVRYNQLQV